MRSKTKHGLFLVLLVAGMIAGSSLVTALFGGCTLPMDYSYDIPDLGIQTVEDAVWWVAVNISYEWDRDAYDTAEYWKSPEQTYADRAGDCEDYSILAMYLIYRDTGLVPDLVIGEYDGAKHAWIYVDGHYWEPQRARCVDKDTKYSPTKHIDYQRALYRATVTHRSLLLEEGE